MINLELSHVIAILSLVFLILKFFFDKNKLKEQDTKDYVKNIEILLTEKIVASSDKLAASILETKKDFNKALEELHKATLALNELTIRFEQSSKIQEQTSARYETLENKVNDIEKVIIKLQSEIESRGNKIVEDSPSKN